MTLVNWLNNKLLSVCSCQKNEGKLTLDFGLDSPYYIEKKKVPHETKLNSVVRVSFNSKGLLITNLDGGGFLGV